MLRLEIMKRPITNRAEAEQFIREMVKHKLAFHWDDRPEDVVTTDPTMKLDADGRLFYREEIFFVEQRVRELYELQTWSWNDIFRFTMDIAFGRK